MLKKGIDVILLYRVLKNQDKEDAKTVTYQTEHSFAMSRSSDSTPTKDGNVQSTGAIEYDFSSTALYERGSETIKMLHDAFTNNETIEVWIVDKLDKDEKGKFAAKYLHADITNYEETANSEDNVELSLEYGVQLVHQDGYATLSQEQEKTVQYAFEDTVKKTPEG